MDAKLIRAARATAQAFLDRRYAASPPKDAGDRMHAGSSAGTVWFDDATPLFEISIADPAGRPRAGYLLVSADRRLPPVLEYSFEGDGPAQCGQRELAGGLQVLGQVARGAQIYYMSPFELVARIDLDGRSDAVYVTLPDLRSSVVAAPLRIRRNPRTLYSAREVTAQWAAIDNWTKGPHVRAGKVLYDRQPVRYSQTCDNKRDVVCVLDVDKGGTRCTPGCIVGCTPTAWGMIASGWKRFGAPGAEKIWAGASDWAADWPTTPTLPAPSTKVNDCLWDLHRVMATGCEGNTGWWEIERGGPHLSKTYGLTWTWAHVDRLSFDNVKQLIDSGRTFVFSGGGYWDAVRTNNGTAPAKLAGAPRGGKKGDKQTWGVHSVAAYGYDVDSANWMLISLGWGSNWADKYMNYAMLDNFHGAYLKGFTARAAGKSSGLRGLASILATV
jgi:hypothetical protein